jgi:hypothetical protein
MKHVVHDLPIDLKDLWLWNDQNLYVQTEVHLTFASIHFVLLSSFMFTL